MSLKHSFSESARPTLTPPVPPEGSEQMQTNALFAVAPLPDVDLTLSAWLVSVSMTKMPLFSLKNFCPDHGDYSFSQYNASNIFL